MLHTLSGHSWPRKMYACVTHMLLVVRVCPSPASDKHLLPEGMHHNIILVVW